MSPEQARRIYEVMSKPLQERMALLAQWVRENTPKVDAILTRAGQQMADDAEAWLRDRSNP